MKPKMDMLNGSIWNKIIQYALPVAATGILEQLFNASDLAIVGNFTGKAKTVAVAAVGANSPIIGLLLNFFIGIALGANVVIANAVSSVFLFIKLVKTDQAIRIRKEELRFDGNVFGRIIRIGLPAGVQSAVFSIANIVIQAAINSLGTVVIAASSAAFNIEIFAYYMLNSFSQACTTFTGQNYGAGQLKRCRKVLRLCIVEDFIATAATIILVLLSGKVLLSIFNDDPQVISIGYTRLLMVFSAYIFSMLYENLSGYLRGFGISLVPAILTIIGVCGVRIFWIFAVFPQHKTFTTIMMAYPISLATTAVLIFIATMFYRPSHKLNMQ